MLFDPLYLIMVAPAFLLALYAQAKVRSAYARFSRVTTRQGLTGGEAARRILDREGLSDVPVQQTQGWLSDHYDPRTRTLKLSPEVYAGRSVAAVGVAAHEAGHALQHASGYAAMQVRSFMVPAASIGSWMAWPMIVGGLFLHSMGLIQIGIILFAAMVVFQVVTLPVEFNASSRAKALLTTAGIVVTEQEAEGVRRMLSAAAMTYVAATVTAVMTLLYFLVRFGFLGRSRR